MSSNFKSISLVIYIFLTCIVYEITYKMLSNPSFGLETIYLILFSLFTASIIWFLSSFLHNSAFKWFISIATVGFHLVFSIYIIYFSIFNMPLSLYSVIGAKEAFQMESIVINALIKNSFLLVYYLIGGISLCFVMKSFDIAKKTNRFRIQLFASCIVIYGITICAVIVSGDSPVGQKTQYFNGDSIDLSIQKLGVLTTIRLDCMRIVKNQWDSQQDQPIEIQELVVEDTQNSENITTGVIETEIKNVSEQGIDIVDVKEATQPEKELTIFDQFNIMPIDFTKLAENENNQQIKEMHTYFSTLTASKKNEYTGMFKGYNLIFMTCEGFSSYAIDEKLTPTLYEMAHTGFVFNNYYNPVWSVSTSDGEYVTCTGLIPKSGVWSFSRSSNNYLPFVMGNQFKSLGYPTKAYHDHSYTYYDRDISHPNMGYDFKGLGNGLEIKASWPESDLEMMEVTGPEYINQEPFHTYYMTVSGHMIYSFKDNYIAYKNKDYVADLSYSEPVKAYKATQLELEFAMKNLIEQLEVAGVADKTVIVMSADHYPYGLDKKYLDEAAGKTLESNFEIYKSSLIIWHKGMKPIPIDEVCSSLDIIPTISNLFGLTFDSRLLMGNDILSDAPPLAIFSNRSWISDRASYNSQTNKMVFYDGTESDKAYKKQMNQLVNDKFFYSAKILDKDYYGKLFQAINKE